MIPLLRTLTRKSKLGFGKHKDLTVSELLEKKKHVSLVAAYYKLSSINFTEDILEELKIKQENRIQKPSIDYEMYAIVLNKYPKRYRNRKLDKLKKNIKPLSKAALQSYNHGKRKR